MYLKCVCNVLSIQYDAFYNTLDCVWPQTKGERPRNKSSSSGTASNFIKVVPKQTYGTSTVEFFKVLLAETSETEFKKNLILFRSHLKSHNCLTLLKYFDDNLFTEKRIVQWAMWYRIKMYACEWLLNTNNHVESWHNYLKSRILGRKANIRVDTLMGALVQAEMYIAWKWQRTRSGLRFKGLFLMWTCVECVQINVLFKMYTAC